MGNYEGWKDIKHLEFPIEGKLLIYFAANHILNGSYDTAIRVLGEYGVEYFFEGDRGICNKANCQKLLAIAIFKSSKKQNEKDYLEVENLLNKAKQKFTNLLIYHGVAVVSFVKAQFFEAQPTNFQDLGTFFRSEEDILKMALEEA